MLSLCGAFGIAPDTNRAETRSPQYFHPVESRTTLQCARAGKWSEVPNSQLRAGQAELAGGRARGNGTAGPATRPSSDSVGSRTGEMSAPRARVGTCAACSPAVTRSCIRSPSGCRRHRRQAGFTPCRGAEQLKRCLPILGHSVAAGWTAVECTGHQDAVRAHPVPGAADPLLRGDVVITSRTIAGDPDELSDDQIRVLVESVLGIGRRARCTIERRLRRAAETTNVRETSPPIRTPGSSTSMPRRGVARAASAPTPPPSLVSCARCHVPTLPIGCRR